MDPSKRICRYLLLLLGCQLLLNCYGQQQCSPDLPSLDTIKSEARLIGNLVSRLAEQNLIPEITFTCSGMLTRWVIAAIFVEGGERFPELQIFTPVEGTALNRTGFSQLHNATRITENVYEFFPDPPLQFQSRDVLGIHSPPDPLLALQYQENGGPTNYYMGEIPYGYERLTLDEGFLLRDRFDVPLVAVEVSSPECLRGFIDLDTLMVKASILNNIVERTSEQALFPEIGFTCSGLLTSWTILATVEAAGDRYPEFQIFRPTPGSQYNKVETTTFNDNSIVAENVYEFHPDPPLQFQGGDVLGVFTPPSQKLSFRYHENRGFTSYYVGDSFARSELSIDGGSLSSGRRDLPIVAVNVSNPECLTGFIDLDTVIIKASILSRGDITTRPAVQRIIPELAFSCSGTVVNFYVAGLDRGSAAERVSYPEIQIWRRSTNDTNIYNKVERVGNGDAIRSTGFLNVHIYVAIPPIEVQAGDFIGIHQPLDTSSRFQLYLRKGGPENIYIREETRPLETFDTSEMQSNTFMDTQTPLISARLVVATTQQTPSVAETLSTAQIVPIVVCGVLGLLLLVGTGAVVVGVVIYRSRRKRRRKRSLPSHINRHNPCSTGKDSMDYNAGYCAGNPIEMSGRDNPDYSVLQRGALPAGRPGRMPTDRLPPTVDMNINRAYIMQNIENIETRRNNTSTGGVDNLAATRSETIENSAYSHTNIYESID